MGVTSVMPHHLRLPALRCLAFAYHRRDAGFCYRIVDLQALDHVGEGGRLATVIRHQAAQALEGRRDVVGRQNGCELAGVAVAAAKGPAFSAAK